MQSKVREQNYDMLKIISMICIMLIHLGDDYGYSIIEGEPFYYFSLGNICLTLTTFAVPCFLMISGAFLLSNRENGNFTTFYKKTFLNIGIPTLLISVLYVAYNIAKLFYHISLGMEVADTPVKYFMEWFRGEPFYHMWYMYMLVGIYLLVPILVRIKEALDYNVWKIIAIGSLISSVILWATSSFKVHWGLEGILYLGYFLMGDVLKTFYNKHKEKKSVGKLLTGFFILVLYCFIREYLMRNGIQQYLYAFMGNFHPIVMIASVLIFTGFASLKIKGNWSKVAEKSFYMYLLHAGIIDISYNVLPERWNPALFIPVMLIATFIISYIAASILLLLQRKCLKNKIKE